jgi:GT2 family glycosyltransferase
MLSILIPIYNQSIVKLVEELKLQCVKAKIAFEIICLDDFSNQKTKNNNRSVNELMGVNYVELSENIGRSKIRNRLANLARYDHLLFIDSDSKIGHKKYIKNYLQHISKNQDVVICGGTSYSTHPPKSKDKYLHWIYGTHRESPKANIRNKRSEELFHSNNFVCHRKVILMHSFDSTIDGYGYEDLEWALRLQKAGIKVDHIDNPLIHSGLKNKQQFLNDTKQSLTNLAILYRDGKIPNSRLIRFYKKLEKFGLLRLSLKLLNWKKDQIFDKLMEDKPKLIYLDLYKLHYFENAINIDTK